MSGSVIYIRGGIGITTSLADHPEAMSDLKAVANLTDEQLEKIQRHLSEATGFLDPKSLTTIIRDATHDESGVRRLLRVLRNVDPEDVTRVLDELEERRRANNLAIDEDELKRLRRTLPKLVQPYPALARFEKAERLAEITGQRLETCDLICDLRPIFDADRQRLEGMIPYTRLRVVATGADGLPEAFEAELTQQQVHDLAAKAAKAKDKLDVLRKSVETWLPAGLPDLPMTRIPRKESSDA